MKEKLKIQKWRLITENLYKKNKRESMFIIHLTQISNIKSESIQNFLQIKESYNLPLAQIIIQRQKQEMIAQNQQWIKQGYYVDAKDKNGEWEAGLILGITKTQIKIRFDGWALRNDQIFPILTQRLRPFRSITRGYTGPLKTPPIRQHWKFSLDDQQSRIQRLQQFTNSLSQRSGLEITQYFRGQHFFYINHLLTLTFSQVEQFSLVYQYFKLSIKFITQYLEQLTQRQTAVWFGYCNQNQQQQQLATNNNNSNSNEINMDAKQAYSECYYELFEIINMLVNVKNQSFLRGNQKYFKQTYSNQYQQSQPLNQDVTFQQLITKELFKSQFLATYEKLITKLFDQTFAGVKNMPLQFQLSTISLLYNLERLPFSKQIKKRLYLNLLYIVKEHFSALQLADVKIYQRTIEDILGLMRYLAGKLIVLEKQEIYKWAQHSKLKLWAMMIQCDVLQKKLRGITKIKQFYQQIIQKLSNPIENGSVTTNRLQFRSWLMECNLMKMIFQLNQHTQVIKKGCDMFLLFYGSKFKLISINELVYIWQTCFNKHQAIKKVVFQFWQQLAQHVSQQQDWSKFISVLVENDDKIDEREDWEMQAIFGLIKSLQCDEQLQQFNSLIKMVYRKTMSNPKYIPQLAKKLGYLQKDSLILKSIIDDCLQSIKCRNEHVFHLKLLARIFAQLRTQKFYIPANLIPILIEQLEIFLQSQEQNEKLILSIFHIFNEVMLLDKEESSNVRRYEQQQSIQPQQQYQGLAQQQQHTSTITNRTNTITNKLSSLPLPLPTRINLQHFEKLWQMFSKVQNNQIKRILYSWIIYKTFNSMYNFYMFTINPRFTFQFRNEIFFNFLCDQNKLQLHKMDLNQFIVFREFFIFVNFKSGSIEIKQLQLDQTSSVHKKIIRVRNNQLKGIQYLWEIFKHCPQNEQLVNSVCTFIKDLYMRTSHGMSKQDKQRRAHQLMSKLQQFVVKRNSAKQSLQQQSLQTLQVPNETTIRRALILIQKLLADMKQIIKIPKDFERLQKTDKISIHTYISMSDQKALQIYTQEPFIAIKQKIAKMWNLQKDQFILMNGKQQVFREMYQLPYYLHGFQQRYFRIIRLPNEYTKSITLFIYQQLHYEIISYLKAQHLAQESFNVLQMLQIDNPLKLYHLLQGEISTVEEIQYSKKRIYLHIYFLRVIELLLMEENIVWGEQLVRRLVQHLSIRIEDSLVVQYLEKLIEMLTAIRKKCKDDVKKQQLLLIKQQKELEERQRQHNHGRQQLQEQMGNNNNSNNNNNNNNNFDKQQPQQQSPVPSTISTATYTTANTILPLLSTIPHTTTLLLHLIHYINNHPKPQSIYPHENRLFNLTIIFYMNTFPNTKTLFNEFIKDCHFKQLMQQIFVQCDFLALKKNMQRRISSWMKDGFNDQQTQKKFSEFFVNQLYYKIHNKSLVKKLKVECMGLFSLFRTIIQTISNEAFQYITHKPIIFNNLSQQQQFYYNQHQQTTLPNYIIQSFKQQQDSPMQTNYLLNGQLQVLIALIKRNRNIVNKELVQYLLYECLIYLPGATRGVDVKCLAKENVILVIQLLQMLMVNVSKKVLMASEQSAINTMTNTSSISSSSSSSLTKQSLALSQPLLLTITPTQSTTQILMNLQQFHILDYWRSSKQWSLEYQQISRTKYQFVGLENPGCVCYINSLLQQLFMIEEFRWAVLKVKGNDSMQITGGNDFNNNQNNNLQSQQNNNNTTKPINSPQLIPKLKILFLQLLLSQRPSIDPLFFTSSLKTTTDRPLVKIFQQMDIDQFSMILFDKIQNHLHHLNERNFIRELFGGTYSNEIISLQCKHSSEREEQFLSISLDVKKHINESFMSLVKGEILEGENAYYCQHCDRKVKAMKRLSIKRLPPHLIVSLRRFQFDYQIDQKIKINKYCEFPLQLNLQNYSQQKLNENVNKSNNNIINEPTQRSSSRLFSQVQLQQQNQQNQQQNQQSQNNNNQQHHQQSQQQQHLQSNYFTYKLKGVVIHSGSADSGHYYSFIQNKDGRWFQFNDEKVTEFDVNSLEEEAFGARDGEYVKIKNAYLLFYQRVEQKRQSKEKFAKTVGEMVSEEVLVGNDNKNSRSSQHMYLNKQSMIPLSSHQPQSSYQPLPCQSTQPPSNLPTPILTHQNMQIIQQIIKQNKKIREYHLFFSQQYLQFVINIVQYFLIIFDKHTTTNSDDNLKQLLLQMAKQIRLMNIDNLDITSIRKNKLQLMKDTSIIKGLFHYLIGYVFCMQLRQKNQFITIWLLQAINKLFFQHQVPSARIQFMQLFLSSILRQQFIEQYLIQSSKQKSRLVVNFVVNVFTNYLRQKNVCQQKKDYHVKKLFKIVMKNIVMANSNLPQLITIMRKVLFIRQEQQYTYKLYQLIQWIVKRQFVNILVQNILSNAIQKDILQKITKLIQSDYSIQLQHIQQTYITNNNERSLFGTYEQRTKSYVKSPQKETFLMLWQLWHFIRSEKSLLQRENQFLSQVDVVEGVERLYSKHNSDNGDQSVRQSSEQATPNKQSLVQQSQKSLTIQIENNNPSQIHHEQQQNVNQHQDEKEKIINKYIWLNYILHKFYTAILPIKPEKLIKIISQQKDTKSAVALASFISQFVYDNKTFSDITLVALQNGLKDYESSKYRPIFICIEKLLEIQDSLTQKRRVDILRVLRSALKHNDKFFNQCDFTHQWMIRYASRFEFFQTLLRENPAIINEIRYWITQKRYPGQETIKKHRQQNCDRFPFRLHGLMVSGEIKDYENLSNCKYQWFEKIKTREFTSSINYRQLNVPNEQYNVGDVVECYYDTNTWMQGTVEGSYYGIIYVVFGKKNNKLQHTLYFDDDEKLRLKRAKRLSESQVYDSSKMEIEK